MTFAQCAYVGALLLAAVLAAAGGAKLAHHRETADALRALRLPASEVVAWVVPVFELVAAVALVAAPAIGGAIALFLLTAFTAVLVDVVRRDAALSCGCFGTASSHPVAPADVVRNVGLAVLAGAALWSGSVERPSLTAVGVVLAAAACWAVLTRLTRRAGSGSRPAGA